MNTEQSHSDGSVAPGSVAGKTYVCESLDSAIRDLRALFDPRSLALVGASADASKWGGDMAARLVRNERHRPFYFVNQKGGMIQGRRAYPSLSQLPERPEMVMLTVPVSTFEATLDEALSLGAKAVIVISAGLGETGEEGKTREAAAVQRVRAHGALMIGPNCMGAADTSVGFQGVAYLDIPEGEVGFISQSGGVGEEFTMRARAAGIGFSRYVTLGNQADVTVTRVLRSYRDHEPTKVVAIYVEELKDGREFARAAADLVAAGKPVILLAPGRSEASARAARSHTGSLVPDSTVLEAVAEATGIVRVGDPAQLFQTTLGFLHTIRLRPGGRLPAGHRVGIVTEGGGHGACAADCADASGLRVPPLSATTIAGILAAHPAARGSNPIDFAIGTTDPDAYARVVPLVADSGEVDSVLVVGQLGYWAARFPEFEEQVSIEVESARLMAAKVRRAQVPLIVATVYPDAAPAKALLAEGVPVYREITSATVVLGRLADHARHEGRAVPALLPEAAPPLAGRTSGADGALDYWAARQVLKGEGIEFVPAHLVECCEPDDLAAAAAEAAQALGFPVAVKAMGLLHKSDQGGVALGLDSPRDVAGAVARMVAHLPITSVAVEGMAPVADGVELIVGCKWDRRFGPVLLVGIGGLYAEVLTDARTDLAPVDEEKAVRLLRALRGAPLLLGSRGRRPMNLAAAGRSIAALSRFASTHSELAEVEINPLLVTPSGAVALDARIILA